MRRLMVTHGRARYLGIDTDCIHHRVYNLAICFRLHPRHLGSPASPQKRHFVMPVTQADTNAQYVGKHRRSGGPSTEDLSWPAIPVGFFGS
jgi:hypothetical protein